MALPKYIYDKAPDKYFTVNSSDLNLSLKGEIVAYRKNNETNNFCAIGLEWNNGSQRIDIFWKEITRLYYWDGGGNPPMDVFSLTFSKGINYEADVVDTKKEIGFSTYLMVRSDVETLLRDCEIYGQKIVIRPFKIPEKCTQYDNCSDPLGLRVGDDE